MLVRVFMKPDGTVSVLIPNPRLRLDGESEADFLERIYRKDGGGLLGLPYQDVAQTDLPPRADRKEWTIENARIVKRSR